MATLVAGVDCTCPPSEAAAGRHRQKCWKAAWVKLYLEFHDILEGNAGRRAQVEMDLAEWIERRVHAMGKELRQPYETTAEFCKRLFEGLPAHVQPGKIAPYNVEEEEQPVLDGKSFRTGADGLTDFDRPTGRRAAQQGDPPDIMR